MPNPLEGLRHATGIQADPSPMAQFRSNHPWIAKTADFLTGGATDPYKQMGPADVLMSMVPLSGAVTSMAERAAMREAPAMMGLARGAGAAEGRGIFDPTYTKWVRERQANFNGEMPHLAAQLGPRPPGSRDQQALESANDFLTNQQGLDWMNKEFEANKGIGAAMGAGPTVQISPEWQAEIQHALKSPTPHWIKEGRQ